MGLDGKNKMSKSLNNYISVLDDSDTIQKKLRTAFTDENRIKRTDPGNPDICNIFSLHDTFSSADEIQEVNENCRAGTIGCVDCKNKLRKNLDDHFGPIREKAASLYKKPDEVRDILSKGASHCRAIAQDVMEEVRKKTGLR